MTEKEMLNCLLAVWENMTSDKDREAYKEMLSAGLPEPCRGEPRHRMR